MRNKKQKKAYRVGGIGLIFAGAVLATTVNVAIGLALLAIGIMWIVLSLKR